MINPWYWIYKYQYLNINMGYININMWYTCIKTCHFSKFLWLLFFVDIMHSICFIWSDASLHNGRREDDRWNLLIPYKRLMIRSVDVPLILAWTSCSTNNRVVGDLKRHDAHVTSLSWRNITAPKPQYLLSFLEWYYAIDSLHFIFSRPYHLRGCQPLHNILLAV